MKSMVKILVTIMALSLAEAPVFAAWPAERMNKAAKVKHLVSTYGCNHAEINKLTVPQLNTLEAELSAAAVVPADEVFGVGVLALAHEVVGGGADGVAVGVPAVGAKRQRIKGTGVDFPQLDSRLQVAPTNRAILIANGQFVLAKQAEENASNTLSALKAHFEPGGDKVGMNSSEFKGLPIYQGRAAHATQDRREAQAQHVFLLKRNSLSRFFDGINQQLGALTAPDAVVTAADINAFIATIEEVIGAVRQEDGTMSSGTQAIYDQYVKPFNDYAQALRLYVAELEKNKKELIARAGGLSAIDFSALLRSYLIPKTLIAAASLAGAVVGWQAGVAIIVGTTLIPFTPAAICTFQAGMVFATGAFAGGALAAMVTQGGAAGDGDSSSAKKRKHNGDDKV